MELWRLIPEAGNLRSQELDEDEGELIDQAGWKPHFQLIGGICAMCG